jgi:hypothetical protein
MHQLKKIVPILLFVFTYLQVKAQYNIQATLPTGGLIQKNQLWNLLVINGTNLEPQAKVELSLRNRTTNIEEITASTSMFKLQKGGQQMSFSSLSPIIYNNVTTTTNRLNNGELIPVGNYSACFRLIIMVNGEPEIGVEECINFDVEPLSPPMLATPDDSTVFNVPPTNFTWIPPTPTIVFNQLQYDVIFTEILPAQKPEEAIQQNVPFYIEQNVQSSMLVYSGMQQAFVKDKWYAWQVTAKDGNSYASKSEVWTFKISDTALATIPVFKSYILLEDFPSENVFTTPSRNFNFKYKCPVSNYLQIISFRKANGDVIKTEKRLLSYGDNYVDTKLNNSQFNVDEPYKLILSTPSGKPVILNFKLIRK